MASCDFLKINCEGSEYDISMNAEDSVLQAVDRVACERHRFDAEHDPVKLATFLDGRGFELVEPKSQEKTLGMLHAYRTGRTESLSETERPRTATEVV